MLKNIWVYVVVATIVGAGGWFYFAHHQTTINQPPAPATSQPIVVQPNRSDDELARKRQEGIGSIKELRPVQIEPRQGK
jgi:hypothetical protein